MFVKIIEGIINPDGFIDNFSVSSFPKSIPNFVKNLKMLKSVKKILHIITL